LVNTTDVKFHIVQYWAGAVTSRLAVWWRIIQQ